MNQSGGNFTTGGHPPFSGILGTGGGGGGAPVNAQYLVLAADGTLTQERVFTPAARLSATDGGAGAAYTLDLATIVGVAGSYTYASLTVDGYGRVTAASNGTAPAPNNAQYLTLALDGTLTNERRFVAAAGLTAVDGGAGADYTLSVGSGAPAITVVAVTPYAASANTFLVVKPSVATIVINLPAGVLDTSIIIKHGNASLFDVQVNPNGADTIDGQTSYLLTTRQSLTLTFEGGVWHSR